MIFTTEVITRGLRPLLGPYVGMTLMLAVVLVASGSFGVQQS